MMTDYPKGRDQLNREVTDPVRVRVVAEMMGYLESREPILRASIGWTAKRSSEGSKERKEVGLG